MAKELTPKQAHFARCVAQGMTQADAYSEAYDPKQSNHCGNDPHTSKQGDGTRVEIRSRVDALVKARERAVVASALSDRDKVLSKLRVWLEGTEVTDSNRLRAAELLGRSSGLFATDINVTTKERDSSAVAAEIEQRLAALLVSTADASDALDDADAGGSIH
jgi:hypothetical protein